MVSTSVLTCHRKESKKHKGEVRITNILFRVQQRMASRVILLPLSPQHFQFFLLFLFVYLPIIYLYTRIHVYPRYKCLKIANVNKEMG